MEEETTLDVWLIGAATAITAVLFTYAIPEHVVDPNWPDHARNHVFQALFWIDGFSILQLAVVWFPYRRGEPWSWWGLAASGLAVYGGYFVPILVTRGGAPGLLDDVVFGALFVVYAAGLALGASRFR